MRSFNGLLAALLATCGAAQVGAAPILVDAFNGPDMFVADTTINGVGVQVGPVGPVNPPVNTLSRTVGHNFLAGTNPGGTGSSVTVGSQTFPSGALSIENGATRDSTVFVSWVLPTGFINTYAAGPLALAFDVLAASGSATFEVSWRGASLGSRSIANFSGPGSALALLALTSTQQDAINNASFGDVLQITFDGALGFWLTVDNVRFQAATPVTPPSQAPEPGTLALVGLALAGTMAAARRRRG